MADLIMEFATDNHEFKLGFEAALIFTKVESGEILKNYPFHSDNKRQVEIIMETFNNEYEFEFVSDPNWMVLHMKDSEASKLLHA